MDEQQQNLWTKDFIFISVINFFLMLVMYLLIVTIAPFAVKEYGASTSMAGLVSGIFIIGTLIARIATGSIIGKVGSKKILFIGLVVSLIATAFYFGAHTMPLLLVNRLFHGVGLGIASTATGTMVAQIIPPSRRGEGIGYFSMSSVLSTAVGPFLGIYMSQHFEFNIIFILCFVFAVIGLIMFLFLKGASPVAQPAAQETLKKRFNIANYIEVKALPIAVITLLAGVAYSGVLSFLSFYAIEVNLVKTASFFFLVYAFVVLLSRPFSGRLLDVKGAKIIVYPALILFATGLLVLSQVQNGFMLLAAGALIGLGFGNFQSCAQAIALKGIPVERMGVATSTFYIFLDFGFGFGPYFLGNIATAMGYSHMYLLLMGVVVVALIAFLLLFGRKKAVAEVV
ncbi:MFS transporter [Sporosarcina sp. Sa2YVA2]|uniref:MFS transporter n=1 Tax=Sporosarcina quadrami TaxID=2762234 RepID=A0ABR8U8H6_9BACL|nr:MFS transporter [Sporosarcina quadrami]MBD7984105.1 MFS transporter [Sporosarcina quadrami]